MDRHIEMLRDVHTSLRPTMLFIADAAVNIRRSADKTLGPPGTKDKEHTSIYIERERGTESELMV